jgi:beta-aspartyl-peptidase (threonine type)
MGRVFYRSVVAHDISALMEYKGLSIQEAAHTVIHDKVGGLGGDGGVVGIDSKGNVAMEMNTPGMYRAHMDAEGKLNVKIYKD